MKKLTVKQIDEKVKYLKGERGTWENHWQEVSDYFIPKRSTIVTKRTPGQKISFELLDNIGVQSNETLAGALHGLLTNTDSQWFEFTTGDLVMDNDDEVRLWLQQAARATHNVLNNSNFHTELHEMYLDLPSLGTGCMLIEEDEKTVIRFSTKAIENYYISENARGVVDCIYSKTMLSAKQLVQEFGAKKMHKDVVKCDKEDKEQKFCMIHAVYPSYEGKGYISQYVLPELDYEISVGKFHEMPYVTPRFSKMAGEVYGRSPAMTALPEMKVLHKMNETLLIGMQKQVDPPLQLEDDGVLLPLVTRPGGINYRRAGAEPITPLFRDTRIDMAYQALTERRQRVRDTFHVDQLKLSVDQKYMTATEVLQRTEQSMRLLGPLVGRMQQEFLRPLIDRVFRIMMDRGLIPQPPQILSGRSIDVRYSSLIAKSQKVAEGQNVLRTVEAIAPFLQIDGQVADNFNGDAILRYVAGTFGFPQEGLRSAKELKNIRGGRMQQQQAMMAQVQQQQQAVSEREDMATMAKAQKDLNGAV